MEVAKNNWEGQASHEIPPKMDRCAKIPMVEYMLYKKQAAPRAKLLAQSGGQLPMGRVAIIIIVIIIIIIIII